MKILTALSLIAGVAGVLYGMVSNNRRIEQTVAYWACARFIKHPPAPFLSLEEYKAEWDLIWAAYRANSRREPGDGSAADLAWRRWQHLTDSNTPWISGFTEPTFWQGYYRYLQSKDIDVPLAERYLHRTVSRRARKIQEGGWE